jgi:hypothetical protein
MAQPKLVDGMVLPVMKTSQNKIPHLKTKRLAIFDFKTVNYLFNHVLAICYICSLRRREILHKSTLTLFLSDKSVQTSLIQKVYKELSSSFSYIIKKGNSSLLFSRNISHQGNLPRADLMRWHHREEILP